MALALTLSGCEQSVSAPPKPAIPPPSTTKLPDVFPVDQVDLDEKEPVIGIAVNGRHRAYLIRALTPNQKAQVAGVAGKSLKEQVVNDVVAEIPITVTYCSQSDRGRVFKATASPDPLTIEVADGPNQQLMLRWLEQKFPQAGSPGSQIPASLEDHPFERTTWGEWKRTHPDTEVYLGALYEN